MAATSSWVLMLVLGSRLTFLLDDWDFLLFRGGFGADQILTPHNEHIVIVPVLIYKSLLATFGMTSQQPFRLVSTAVFMTSAVCLFCWLRRRLDGWLALVGVVPILFLGSSAENLLWPFPQLGFCGPIAAGLGAFLALDRGDRRGDRLACALLTLSVLFGSLGLAFVAGALVQIGWDRRRWRRCYIAAIPIGAYFVWWLGWGSEASSSLSLHNMVASPTYIVNGLGSGVFSLLGQVELSSLGSAALLVVVLGALVGLRIHQLGRIPRWLAVVITTALAFWLSAALNASSERDPTSPRYQYVAAVFTLLIAAELLRGVRIGRRVAIVGLAIVAVATATNLVLLHRAFETYRTIGEKERGGLAGLEIGRDVVDPEFQLSGENSGTHDLALVSALPYFTAIDAYGSPAYTEAELRSAPEPARVSADQVLWNALPGSTSSARVRPAGPPPAVIEGRVTEIGRDASCAGALPGPAGAAVLTLPPGGAVILRPGRPGAVGLRLRRYARDSFPIGTGSAGPAPTVIRIPADRSEVPWKLEMTTRKPVVVCGLGTG